MRIIKEGKLPGDRVGQVECPNCHTHFEFKASEAKFVSEQRDGDYYRITCPFVGCGHSVCVDKRHVN